MTDISKPGFTLVDEELGSELLFNDFYLLDKKLRSGSYGTVYSTKHSHSRKEYAVKIIDRTKLKKKSDDQGVFREVEVMKDLNDIDGIVSVIDFFVKPNEFHIVQDLAHGGDVFDRLAKKTVYTERDACELAKRLLETMHSMHERGYVHRDMKPENLLLRHESHDADILVADFGFSKKVPQGGLKTKCGTPAFVAPEILLGAKYSQQVDMWSVGVLLFLLLGGYPPFQDENHHDLFRKIRAADYIFHESYWEHVSIEAKQLISSLLIVNPKSRWTAEQTLNEAKLFKLDYETLKKRDLTKTLTEVRHFCAKRKLKSVMHAVSWMKSATFWSQDTVTFSQQIKQQSSVASTVSNDTTDEARVRSPLNLTLTPPPVDFRSTYELKEKIRKGSFATVWECVHKETKDMFAVKIINREGLKPSDDEAVMNEVAIMQSLAHRHIVQLVDFYEEKEYFFLVMDYMTGGDVFDRIIGMHHYTEKDARDLVQVLLKAVKFMHDRGVAHRDLKPQNLLLKSKENNANIKVADFGFSRRVHTPQSLTNRCGTPSYVAPEILKNIPHDIKADMWSVGVITYVLLVGYPPFMDEKQQELFRKIRSGEYDFPMEDWGVISGEAIELIKGLLVVDPQQRLTAAEALRMSWFKDENLKRLSSRSLTASLQSLKEKRIRLRTIAQAVTWVANPEAGEDEMPVEHSSI
eukprot:CAMPEP_0194146890 /NCGR_PEP_ID=MMETSP0152-20130528/22213_1 /TAXON_ID=1049557 /ORGANISM="Thalassiothrix antarctica, Strain L6-D1" /LENGTH=690 /DNA_ID=CAMNT_0038847539 /DNA_START=71 /DNA_END=2143 /DNA_ORIENTATION=+